MKRVSSGVVMALVGASLWACQNDVPCVAEGAVKTQGGACDCPDGMHPEQVPGKSLALCVSNDPSTAREGGAQADIQDAGRAAGRDAGETLDARRGNETSVDRLDDASIETLNDDASTTATIEGSDAGTSQCDPIPCPSTATWVQHACACMTLDAAVRAPDCVPSAESCDNKDNDCDGKVDNGVQNECGGCAAIDPAHKQGTSCSNGGKGLCDLPGTYVCLNGTTVCSAPSAAPSPEICDKKDNDCDGTVDDGFVTGGKCTAGTGECLVTGTLECNSVGAVGCSAKAKESSTEICDKKDNDCNGVVDDGFVTGGPCSAGKGECLQMGTMVCNSAGAVACSAIPKAASSAETCDGKDNDCNGMVDDGAKNACGMPCGATCPAPTVCGDGKVTGAEACDIKLTSDWHCSADCSSVRASITAYKSCNAENPACGFNESCLAFFGSKAMCVPYKPTAGVGSCSDVTVTAPFAIVNGTSSAEACFVGCQNTGTKCPNNLSCTVIGTSGNGVCILQ